ncbi:hypothetical protein D3C84_550620 [compost metagenome]
MGQGIEAAQGARHRAGAPEQQFQCLQRLQGTHHPHQGAGDAAALAALPYFGIRRVEAGVAGMLRGAARHQLTLPADGGRRDPGLALLDAGGVDGVAAGEVVAAIDHQIHLGHKLRQAGPIEALVDGDQLHMGVVGRQPLPGQLRLGAAQPLPVEQDLARQVAGVQGVAIGEPQRADPGPGQIEGKRRAEPPQADDQHRLGFQPHLPLFPYLGQHQLSAVSQVLFVTQRRLIREHVPPPA